jgi:hypothetical protein
MKHLLTIIAWIAVALLMAWLMGCANNQSKERVRFYIPPGTAQVCVEYESTVSQTLFLYYTRTKEIEHVSPFSSLCVGEIEQVSDSNSIEAVTESALLTLIKAVKGP